MSYIPNFIPSSTPCEIPSYVEHRARGVGGQIFFRSINFGSNQNTIEINGILGAITYQFGQAIQTITVTITDGNITEEFECTQIQNETTMMWDGSGVLSMRGIINGTSTLITIPNRGTDPEDILGIDPDQLSNFSITLSGGMGGPTDGSIIESIRTGPDATLIAIKSSEDDNGNVVNPPQSRRVQKWDGSMWITYTP